MFAKRQPSSIPHYDGPSLSSKFARPPEGPPGEGRLADDNRPLMPGVALRIRSVDNVGMSLEACWPKLRQPSRDYYLIGNNGDVVPPDLVDEIARAGGIIGTEAWWVGQNGAEGLFLWVA